MLDQYHQLRGGQITLDRRLDRIPFFDPRSKEFPIRELIDPTNQRRTRHWECLAHLDQGAEGACVGFGCTHELISEPVAVEGLDALSARAVYRYAQTIDGVPGEDYEGTFQIAGMETVRRQGYIDGYYWAFGMEDLIMGLSHKGPAVIGISVYEEMMTPDSDGFIRPRGRKVGGHCLLVKGIDVEVELAVLHNSWGDDWGIGGDCYIAWEDLEWLLNNDGEAAFFVGRHKEGV